MKCTTCGSEPSPRGRFGADCGTYAPRLAPFFPIVETLDTAKACPNFAVLAGATGRAAVPDKVILSAPILHLARCMATVKRCPLAQGYLAGWQQCGGKR